MLVLELLGLVLAIPGAIVALHDLRVLGGIARPTARPRVRQFDLSLRVSIRRG
jgi:hypothetical protein